MTTPNLDLPEISENQSQKYVTHNEALRRIDALCQASIIDKDLATPPVSPADGDSYIVAASGTGDWASQDDNIAFYVNGGWEFATPEEGWLCWVRDEDTIYKFNSGWTELVLGSTTFLGLTDAPASFAGQANNTVFVNEAATALEFREPLEPVTDGSAIVWEDSDIVTG